MVVGDLDVMGIATFPPKADAPLVVHPNAVLAGTLSGELFQAVARWDTHVGEGFRGVEKQKPAMRTALDVRWEVTRPVSAEHLFGFGIAEAPDHAPW